MSHSGTRRHKHGRPQKREHTPPEKLRHLVGQDTTENRNRVIRALHNALESLTTRLAVSAEALEVATFMLNSALTLPAKGRLGDLMDNADARTRQRFESTDDDVVRKGLGVAYDCFRTHLDVLRQESSPA